MWTRSSSPASLKARAMRDPALGSLGSASAVSLGPWLGLCLLMLPEPACPASPARSQAKRRFHSYAVGNVLFAVFKKIAFFLYFDDPCMKRRIIPNLPYHRGRKQTIFFPSIVMVVCYAEEALASFLPCLLRAWSA